MAIARKLAIGVGGLLGVLIVGGGVTYLWASNAASSKLAKVHDVHRVDFPIPFPLAEDELAALRATPLASSTGAGAATGAFTRQDSPTSVDLNALATERAVARGEHLVKARYACGECHGDNFGGGVMVDDPAIGRFLAPNLTRGAGSRTLTYTAADWDRIVRHGVKPNGAGTPMPSMDYFSMSDRELSDIVAYIRSLPAIDNEVPAIAVGPVGKVLLASGQLPLSAYIHPTQHVVNHAPLPPPEAVDVVFGKHIAQTCIGCHRQTFAGGPIIGGPPDWPPAANLTQAGLAGWTFEDFERAMKEGVSKNGVALREPMSSMPKMAQRMTDTEMQALWLYIKELPARPTAN